MRKKISTIIVLFASLFLGTIVYSIKKYFMLDSISSEYQVLFSLINLFLFVPLPYLAFRNKRYKIFLTFSLSSLIGFMTSILDPYDNTVGSFGGIMWLYTMMFIVIPAYIIGLISWIFVSWVHWE